MICYIIPIQRSYLGLTPFASTVIRTAQTAALPRLDWVVMKQRAKISQRGSTSSPETFTVCS